MPSGRAPLQIKRRSYETGNYPGLEPPLPTGRPKIEPCGSDSEAADSSFQHSFTGKNSFLTSNIQRCASPGGGVWRPEKNQRAKLVVVMVGVADMENPFIQMD